VAAGEPVVLTRFTLAELYVGVHLADDPPGEAGVVREIAEPFPILEFAPDADERCGRIIAARRRAGHPIDPFDALIAATTMAAGHSLLTRNVKDFADIPGVSVDIY
jgi:predicted nucleic acid-binding protein